VTFGLWLLWVSVRRQCRQREIIHEAEQFLQGVAPREFPLTHSVRAPYGDFSSATIPIAGTLPEIGMGDVWPIRVPAIAP
jgi:maltooligosyltrehalose trehalohydrolase